MFRYSILLTPLLCFACARTTKPALEPLPGAIPSLELDSLGQVYPDTLRAVEGPKTLFIQGKKVKLGKGATLVIQQGSGDNHAPVTNASKSKAPVSVASASPAADVQQTQDVESSAITSGNNSPATTQVKEVDNWYLWLAAGVGISLLVWLYFKIKK